MKQIHALLLLFVAAAFIGCDTPTNLTSPEAVSSTTARDDGMLIRARIAAEAAEARAEATRLVALAEQDLAARKTAPRRLSPSGLIEVPGDFASIQDAIDNASPGDVIRVRGAFKEQGVIIVHVANITLDGTRAHLDGREDIASRILVTADDVRVIGFTLKKMRIWIFGGDRAEVAGNHISHTGSGIVVFGGSEGCIIKNNQSHNNVHGLFLTDTEDNHVEKNNFHSNSNAGIILTDDSIGETPANDNTLIDNNVNGNLRGIRVFGSHGNTITDCTVNSSDFAGIVLFEATDNQITECTVNGNGFGGIVLVDSDANAIHTSLANGNIDVGIKLVDANDNTVEDSKAHGNEVCDAVDGGTGNVFSGNKFGSFNC